MSAVEWLHTQNSILNEVELPQPPDMFFSPYILISFFFSKTIYLIWSRDKNEAINRSTHWTKVNSSILDIKEGLCMWNVLAEDVFVWQVLITVSNEVIILYCLKVLNWSFTAQSKTKKMSGRTNQTKRNETKTHSASIILVLWSIWNKRSILNNISRQDVYCDRNRTFSTIHSNVFHKVQCFGMYISLVHFVWLLSSAINVRHYFCLDFSWLYTFEETPLIEHLIEQSGVKFRWI